MRRRDAPVLHVTVSPEGDTGTRLDASHLVTKMTYEDDEKAADKVTLEVDNHDLKQFDNPLFITGNTIEIAWGYAESLCPLRTAVIKSVKGSTLLKVEALAKSVLMNQQTRSRVFTYAKRSEVVAKIAAENGFGADRQIIEDSEEVFAFVSQVRLSDAQFVRDLAQKEGFEFFVDFDGFHWHRRRFDGRPIRKYVYFTDPDQGDILKFDLDNDVTARPQAPSGSVTAKGRDPKEKSDIEVTVTDFDAAGKTPAPNTKPSDRTKLGDSVVIDPRTGAKTLRKNTATGAVNGSTATSAKGVEREAKAAFIRSQQSTAQITFDAVGDPDLLAKAVIELEFPSKTLTGRYYVKSVKHDVSPGGYTMQVKTRRDGLTGAGAGGPKVDDKGKPNTKDPAKSGELTPKKVVDPKTGETKTVYVETKGR